MSDHLHDSAQPNGQQSAVGGISFAPFAPESEPQSEPQGPSFAPAPTPTADVPIAQEKALPATVGDQSSLSQGSVPEPAPTAVETSSVASAPSVDNLTSASTNAAPSPPVESMIPAPSASLESTIATPAAPHALPESLLPASTAPAEHLDTTSSAPVDSLAAAPEHTMPSVSLEQPLPHAPIESSIPAESAPIKALESLPDEQDDAPADIDMVDETPAFTLPVVPPTAEPLSNAGEHPSELVAEVRAKAEEAEPQASAPSTSMVQFQEQPNALSPRREAAQSYEGPMEINAAQLKFAQSTLKSLKGRREAIAFLKPVDAVALGIPQYHQIVTRPMDFGTIDIKLALTALVLKPNSKPGDKAKQASQFNLDPSQDVYKQVSEFDADVRLVFHNCAIFNGPDSPYTENARVLEAAFDKYMKDVPPASQPSEVVEARVRRPSNPVPTIRRSESDVGGRPKREIHPPPPKDLPYANEPQSSTSEMRKAAKRKAAKKGGKMTAREEAYWAKVAGEELRYCTRVIDDLLKPTHEAVAWVFYDIPSMDFDWAPVYFDMIKKPTSLKQVQKNIRAGKYADADDFDSEMQLLIQNCFTFNPPGSDVYVMGEKLKKVYEEKMQRKPVPPPMVADYEESDVDEDDDEDDDGVSPEFLATLQEQISQLSATLAMLEGAKTPQSAGLIASTKAMLDSLQQSYSGSAKKSKKSGIKRKASDAGLAKKKSKSKSLGSPAGAAGTTADYLPPKKPKTATKKKPQQQSQQPSPSSSKKVSKKDHNSDEDVRNVTYEQKEELAAKITELSEERLDGAIRIINEDKPPNQNDEEEIELDIDELSPKTLYKLYKYVVRPKKTVAAPVKGNGKSAPLDGRKRGTGGIKKKNLDEGEEAERIARLQQQLEQFGNPDTGASARGHDDLVHSESSSDESASDSDSD